MSDQLWTSDPQAKALLADCGANPPAEHIWTETFAVGFDRHCHYSRKDRRVRLLDKIRKQCLAEAVPYNDGRGDVAALKANDAITIEDAINAAKVAHELRLERDAA